MNTKQYSTAHPKPRSANIRMRGGIEYAEIGAFQKDFKRLRRKFRTLEEDFDILKRNAIELYHLKSIDNEGIFPVHRFSTKEIQIFKIRKFACKSLKGRGVMSGLRVMYAFHENSFRSDFLEIYFKGEKKNEDFARIKKYLKNI